MRSAGCLTVGALGLLLVGTMLGSLDMLGDVEPEEISVSQYRPVRRTEKSTGPPLFAALLERFQAWESPTESLPQPSLPSLIPSTAQLLFLRSTDTTPGLLTLTQNSPGNTTVAYFSFPLNESNWRLEDLFWQERWTGQLAGAVLHTVKCYTELCAAVVYRSTRGNEYIDRIRIWPQPESGDFDDFELPGAGPISAITLANDTLAYHRFQHIQPFTFLSKVPTFTLTVSTTVYKRGDWAWVLDTAPVPALNSEVVGLQSVRALDKDWMAVTTSYLPPNAGYSGPDGVISTHLLYRTDSQWEEFPDFNFNYTFSPLLFPRQSLSYSVSPLANTTLQVSLVSYPLEHFFLVYQWQESTVLLRQLDLANEVFPRFHVSEPLGEFALLVGEEVVLLRKWREGGSLYQSIFRVNLEKLEGVLGVQEVKGAYMDQTPAGL